MYVEGARAGACELAPLVYIITLHARCCQLWLLMTECLHCILSTQIALAANDIGAAAMQLLAGVG